MRARSPAAAALASAVSLCLLAVACSSGGSKRLIPPPPSTVALLTTAPPGSDFTGVARPGVEGKAAVEPVEVFGGEASFSGVILGPDGPVSGATIRLERFVGDAIGRLDVVSNADGTWRAPQPVAPPAPPPVFIGPTVPGQPPTTLPPTLAPPTTRAIGPQGILGGRYRVRAWRTPDLALTTPQILFLEGKQNRNLGLQLARYTGVSVSSINSPDPPILDTITNVTAVVTTNSVDADGVVKSVPLIGAGLSLTVGPGWLVMNAPVTTNVQGRATFQLRCQALGQSSIDLTVNNTLSFSLPVRACVAPAPTTTTSLLDPNSSSSSVVGSTSLNRTTTSSIP